jgi:glycosyltransferase involved in cell wall biosynthesis
MNILSISSDRKLFEPGSAVRSRTLEYGRLANELHIIVFAKRSLGFHDESFPPNVFLYPTNARTRSGYMLCAIAQALKVKRHGVHIDIVTAQDPFESGLTAFLVARMFGAKLHFQIHTDFLSPYFARESLVNRMRVVLAKRLLPHAHAVRVVSSRIRESLRGVVRAKTPVAVLPIFVDVAQITKTPVTHDLKKEYPQFNFHALMASRLTSEKNIPLALEMFREVVVKYPRAGLVIAGDGPQEAWIRSLVRAHNLEQNVVICGWRTSIVSWMKTADLFLVTSNYEGYGMTIVEALAAGCTVVSTDVGCAREVIQDGVNGFVVSVGDTNVLANVVRKIATREIKFTTKLPVPLTKEEYLAAYKKSWEDALC